MLYYSLIYPHLLYGITSWGSASEAKLNCLLIRQKRAVRIITKSEYNSHSDPLFQKLKILKVFDIYKLQTLQIVFKSIHSLFPVNTSHFLTQLKFHTVLKVHNTRSTSSNLSRITARTNIRNSTLPFTGPRLWNSLDDNFKSLPSISNFRTMILNWMISFYS